MGVEEFCQLMLFPPQDPVLGMPPLGLPPMGLPPMGLPPMGLPPMGLPAPPIAQNGQGRYPTPSGDGDEMQSKLSGH